MYIRYRVALEKENGLEKYNERKHKERLKELSSEVCYRYTVRFLYASLAISIIISPIGKLQVQGNPKKTR
jgi:hypothetical protein